MSTSLKSLMLIGAVSLASAVAAPAALGAETCPNEQLRVENNSTALPDCRAYELVSTNLNHARLGGGGIASADGRTVVFYANDAPGTANSAQPFANPIRSERDSGGTWATYSLSPPFTGPVVAYYNTVTQDVADDLSSTFQLTDQPLSGPNVPSGQNMFVGHADGAYQLVTTKGTPPNGPTPYNQGAFLGGNFDFTDVYFRPVVAQVPTDPISGSNVYSWSEERGLELVGILPGGLPAPNGVSLASGVLNPFSTDGRYVLFRYEGTLYLRVVGSNTVALGPVAVDLSQREFISDVAGVTADGAKVLFTSHAALTPDSDTGATHTGRDLYSYDTASGALSDLTIDPDVADVAGAEVERVLAAAVDGSYVYFTAKGHLAAGTPRARTALYVWHNGTVTFISQLNQIFREDGGIDPPRVYLTPGGRNLIFSSSESLTGYDNTDPVTGQPHAEVFETSLASPLVCVSCRVNGTRPSADSDLPPGGLAHAPRAASDDGSRVFFESRDAVVPQASSGVQEVYEYEHGQVVPLSRLSSPYDALFIGTSASGDDIFFSTFDNPVLGPEEGDNSVFDAHVDGGAPVNANQECSGEACRAPLSSAPVLGEPSSTASPGAGNVAPPSAAAALGSKPLTRARKLARALKACKSKHVKKERATCERRARRTYRRHR